MNTLYRIAWPVVLVTALALSGWSMFVLGSQQYHVPALLALGISATFDGAALICAHIAQRWAESRDSSAGPRLTMLGLLALSAYLNVSHAALAGYGTPARVMFASPAIVSVILFEHERGWRSREARRAAGRVAPALPVIGRNALLFHPLRSLRVVWQITGAHLDTMAPVPVDPGHAEAATLAPAPVPVDTRHAGPATLAPAGPVSVTADPVSDQTVARADTGHGTGHDTSHDTAPDTAHDQAQDTRVIPALAGPAPATLPADQGGPDATRTRELLAACPSDSARIRLAMRTLGDTTPADVLGWLAEHGVTVAQSNVRTVGKRVRAEREKEREQNVSRVVELAAHR